MTMSHRSRSRSNARFIISISITASLLLSLLALLITPAPVAAVTCPSTFSSPCPTATDPIPRLRTWLKDHFFGQDYALQLVESLLNTNLYETRTTPLVLHFSGPTGVGKTSLAHAISEAFFYKKSGDPPQLCGVLKLEMGRIMNEVDDKNRIHILESHLLRPIYHQLKICPRSIIILDDIHFVDVDILNGLKPIFDWPPQVSLSAPLHPVTTPDTPSFPPEPVSSANAIFILTSDLEGSQHELLVDTLTREEAVNIVRDLTSARWGPSNRMLHLVTLVPFLRLTEEHHFKVLSHSFRLFETIIRDQLDREMKARKLSHVIEWVGTVWVQKGTEATILAGQREQTHLYGARAIESYVKQNAYFHINSIVQTFLTARPPEPPPTSPSQPALPPTSPLLSTVIRPATRLMGMRIPLSRDHVVILNDVIVSVDQHHELQIALSNTKTTGSATATGGQGKLPHARGDQRDEL